jgi:uncharacterized protein YecE (DUF72 family)
VIHVGVAGWAYRDWEGVVYPARHPAGFDPLAYLAEYVDCVEVNSTFYRIPPPAFADRWARTVAGRERFRFTAKLWEGFTHERAKRWTEADVRAFHEAVEPLQAAGRLGAVVVQFPWFFERSMENAERVRQIAAAFGDLPLVLEVRNDSWLAPESLEEITALSLNLCNIDLPLARGSIRPSARATGPVGYVRLHGRNARAWFSRTATRDEKYDYLYTEEEEGEWVERVRRLAGRTTETYVVANNHFRGQALVNALSIRSRLLGSAVKVPPPLLEAYPRLRRVALAEEGTGDLFS